MSQFIHCLCALKLDAEIALLTSKDSHDLMRLAESLLQAEKIDHKNSRLSHLMGELYQIRSQTNARAGDFFTAAWQTAMADFVTHRADEKTDVKILESQGNTFLRLGHARLAISAYKVLRDVAPENISTTLAIAQCFRLTNALDEALSELKSISADRRKADCEWLSAVLKLQKTKDYQKFTSWVSESVTSPRELLLAKLWTFSSKQRIFDANLPKVDTIRRKFDKNYLESSNLGVLLKATKTLEQSYDMNLPLRLRLDDLGAALAQRKHLPTVESELLLMAAAIRVLIKFSQKTMAQIVSAEYESLSMQLSRGSKKDALDIFEEIENSYVSSSSPPKSQLARAGELAFMTAKGFGIMASNRSRRVFADAAETARLQEEELENLSLLLSETFGRLKGGMMKVGQILSLISDISPRFVNPLRRMNLAAEASEPSRISQVILEDLGDLPHNVFEEWSDEPIAIGSIGQVYKARLRTGQLVSVKVQHPGVGESLKSDLKLLRLIKPIIRKLFPAANATGIYEEIRTLLLSELDYEQEAKNQENFSRIFSQNPEIVVPRVFANYSGKRIITSEFIVGMRFDEFLREAEQRERNSAAKNIVDAFLGSIWPHGYFNCDPHPNNYLFLEGGKIALLDFGCVKSWNRDFVDAWGMIILSSIENNADACINSWIATGAYRHDQSIDKNTLLHLSRTMCEPVIHDRSYQFTHDFVRRNSDALYLANTKLKKFFTPPPESTMMLRFAWGLYSVLADLEGTDNWHQRVRKHLQESLHGKAGASDLDRTG